MSRLPVPSPHRNVILAVDDSPQILENICRLLAEEADVLVATSGEESLALAQITVPDLILMDVVMPDMDGYETCRRFKEHPAFAELPLLFLSGLEDEEDESKGLALGALDFIHKPFNPTILLTKVRNHLLAKVQQDTYKNLALKDGLTGIPNRRCFDETLAKEWERAVRGFNDLSLLMVDVDLFKAFNDHQGHAEGDQCLRRVASALESALPRKLDFLARYGGEEFAVILPATNLPGALKVAEGMRAAVEALKIPALFTPAQCVTVSLGAACMRPKSEVLAEQLIIRADKGLYTAKRDGRNRVGVEGVGFQIVPHAAPAGEGEPPQEMVKMSDKTLPFILLVDDDARMRTFVEGRLARMETTITALPEADSASRFLAGQVPDLILSDVVMPGMDGFEFCRRCKEDSRLKEVPFVLLTAVSRNLRERALGAGADDYLSKMELDHIFRMRVRTNLELGLNRVHMSEPEGAQILIVTKSVLLHRMLSNHLNAMGIPVREALDLSNALEALDGGRTDLMVLDGALLPHLPADWFDRLRDLPNGLDLPILAVASAQEDALLLGVESEFQDRLSKPLEASEVRHRIQRLLRLGQARKLSENSI